MFESLVNKPENLLYFLVFVIPGFISLKFYELKIPSIKREWADSLVEVVSYSMLNLAVMWFPATYLVHNNYYGNYPVLFWFCSFLILFVMPVIWAFAILWFRLDGPGKNWMLNPHPKAWDYYFSKYRESWILFHLKGGKLVGGYFGGKSYASGFPQEPEVYVEKAFGVDEQGRFVKEIEGTYGLIVRYVDCERVEFLKVEG